MTLHLSQDAEADALLSSNPFALLVGMVLDQQVPLEWAFASPKELERRLGRELDARRIAHMDPEDLVGSFSAKPALHRYPGSMATRVQELATLVTERYGGRAEEIWAGASSGADLFKRVKELPGFGEQKAKIFVALLGKQLGVQPAGWEAVSTPFSEPGSFCSVADITDTETLAKVRAYKQELKAAHKKEAAAKASEATATKPTTTKRTAAKATPKTKGKTAAQTNGKTAGNGGGKSSGNPPKKTAAKALRTR